mmetsp:Transcript_113348/g.315556  ORF Transcript_113348/g.315556 Transcript_113348/m.315556 type:complete len:86 (+) Transcript_113348:65-322(+)
MALLRTVLKRASQAVPKTAVPNPLAGLKRIGVPLWQAQQGKGECNLCSIALGVALCSNLGLLWVIFRGSEQIKHGEGQEVQSSSA